MSVAAKIAIEVHKLEARVEQQSKSLHDLQYRLLVADAERAAAERRLKAEKDRGNVVLRRSNGFEKPYWLPITFVRHGVCGEYDDSGYLRGRVFTTAEAIPRPFDTTAEAASPYDVCAREVHFVYRGKRDALNRYVFEEI